MPTLLDFVRHLRPGMTKADVDCLADISGGMLTSATLSSESRKQKSNWPFEAAKPCQVSFDDFGVITAISFPPEATPIAGIQAGMTKEHLIERFPDAVQLPKFDLGTTSKNSIWILHREPPGLAAVAFFGSKGTIDSLQFRVEEPLVRRVERSNAMLEDYARRRDEDSRQQERERVAAQEAWQTKQQWKRTAPPNEVLLDWAKSHSAWGEGPRPWIDLANWMIENSTPDDRHVILQGFNWDHGLDLIAGIVRQVDTEIATVLDTFWRIEDETGMTHMVWQEGGPPNSSVDLYDLFVEIGDKLHSGFYSRSSKPIEFEGRRRPLNLPETILEVQRKLIPEIAYQSIEGRKVSDKTHKLKMPVNVRLLA